MLSKNVRAVETSRRATRSRKCAQGWLFPVSGQVVSGGDIWRLTATWAQRMKGGRVYWPHRDGLAVVRIDVELVGRVHLRGSRKPRSQIEGRDGWFRASFGAASQRDVHSPGA